MAQAKISWTQIAAAFFERPKHEQSEQNMAQMFQDEHCRRNSRHLLRIRELERALSNLLDEHPDARAVARKLLGRT